MPDLDDGVSKERLSAALSRLILRFERRTGRPLDRARLAARLNLSRSSLYAYLNGTTLPRGEVLDRLLHALGAEPAEQRALSTLRDELELAQTLGRSPAAVRRRRPVLRRLAAATPHFAGRHAELAALDDLAEHGHGLLAVIEGAGGVGKTTLALRWAEASRLRHPDGELHIDLRGFAPGAPLDPAEALHGFLSALGVPPAEIPPDLDGRTALYREQVTGRRILVLLDNARSSDHVRPLLPCSLTCTVLITSRDRMEGLVVAEGASRITLDVMPYFEALDMLERRIGRRRIAAEAEAADELMELCSRLPLALAVAASRTGSGGLGALVTALRRDRLDTLRSTEPALDPSTVFRASYNGLSASAARLFRLLGLHPGPSVDAYACSALMGGISPAAARLLLNELADTGLVACDGDRFAMHDLLRAFARDLSRQEGEADLRAALQRLLSYALGTAHRAASTIRPGRPDELPPPGAPWPAPPVHTLDLAMEWFAAEYPVLRALSDQAAEHGLRDAVWRIAWSLTVFLRRTSRHVDRVELHRRAVAVADDAVHAVSLRLLADALIRLGPEHGSEAAALLERSRRLCRDLGLVRGEFQALLSEGRLHDGAERLGEALCSTETALALSARTGDPMARADALAAVAHQRERLGRHAEALGPARRALLLYRRLAFPEGQAAALRVLGSAQNGLDRLTEARQSYELALQLNRRLNDRHWENAAARSLTRLSPRTGDSDDV